MSLQADISTLTKVVDGDTLHSKTNNKKVKSLNFVRMQVKETWLLQV